jgi:AcrR family transcriptional regulator
MRGRPRDLDLDQRLLAAGWSLLQSGGYDGLTLTKVASQAGAHRTDVYRRWSSKAQLVVDVLEAHLPPVVDLDTGSLDADLRAVVAAFAASWSASWVDGLVGLTADLQGDPDAELAFRKMAEQRGAPLRNAITRATQRGEISPPPDLSLVGDLIEGPLMHRRMVGRAPLTSDYLDAVARAAHRLLTATPVPR